MKTEQYVKTYFPDGRFTFGAKTSYMMRLKEVHEVPNHPPWDKINKLIIVKVGKGYVLLGSVMCNFIDGKASRWFEIAMHSDKNELKVWRDLHNIS